MGRIEDRIAELGLTLHGPHPPHHPLAAVVVHDGIARTSGQLPRIDGALTCIGVLGDNVSVDEGREAARVCALNALAVLKDELGDLDRIARLITLTGFVASAPGFDQQPAVVDGASSVLFDIFGEPAGRHTRSAIGVAALPRGGAVEIELTVAVTG
jgi:enamine deaminase RidA (YjgF/YER057c/UK114 family)